MFSGAGERRRSKDADHGGWVFVFRNRPATALAVPYRNDAIALERNLSPEERLLFHQAQSGPTMEELHAWLARQFDQRRVEPNSALGGANPFDYLTELDRHAEELSASPQDWMPWNYRQTLDGVATPSGTAS